MRVVSLQAFRRSRCQVHATDLELRQKYGFPQEAWSDTLRRLCVANKSALELRARLNPIVELRLMGKWEPEPIGPVLLLAVSHCPAGQSFYDWRGAWQPVFEVSPEGRLTYREYWPDTTRNATRTLIAQVLTPEAPRVTGLHSWLNGL